MKGNWWCQRFRDGNMEWHYLDENNTQLAVLRRSGDRWVIDSEHNIYPGTLTTLQQAMDAVETELDQS